MMAAIVKKTFDKNRIARCKKNFGFQGKNQNKILGERIGVYVNI